MSSDTPDLVHGNDAQRWGGWTWRDPRPGEHYRTCSHCGSISPEDLAAEPSWQPSWADPKYGWPHKLYVDVPNRHPEQLFLVGTSNNPDRPADGWIPVADIPEGTLTDGWRDLSPYRWALVGTRPVHRAKLYSVHLADPNLPQDTRDRIAAASGIRFVFEDDRVTWLPYEGTAE